MSSVPFKKNCCTEKIVILDFLVENNYCQPVTEFSYLKVCDWIVKFNYFIFGCI